MTIGQQPVLQLQLHSGDGSCAAAHLEASQRTFSYSLLR
jgi:hypothetical protein